MSQPRTDDFSLEFPLELRSDGRSNFFTPECTNYGLEARLSRDFQALSGSLRASLMAVLRVYWKANSAIIQ